MPKYYERDRDMVRPPIKATNRQRPPVLDQEDLVDSYDSFTMPQDASTLAGVGNDEEGAAISVDLFNLMEAERVAVLRARKEAEIALAVLDFDNLLDGSRDGTILYWEREFERKEGAPKLYRYAALFSDGLWWITGRHPKPLTRESLTTELIRQNQRAHTIVPCIIAPKSPLLTPAKPRTSMVEEEEMAARIRESRQTKDPELERLLDEEQEIEARIRILNNDRPGIESPGDGNHGPTLAEAGPLSEKKTTATLEVDTWCQTVHPTTSNRGTSWSPLNP